MVASQQIYGQAGNCIHRGGAGFYLIGGNTMTKIPWEEAVALFSIHPEAADAEDVARMAAELMEANRHVFFLTCSCPPTSQTSQPR